MATTAEIQRKYNANKRNIYFKNKSLIGMIDRLAEKRLTNSNRLTEEIIEEYMNRADVKRELYE